MRDKVFFADYFQNGLLGIVEENRIVEYNIAAKKLECFDLDGFEKKSAVCNHHDNRLTKHILDFSGISQKLLFSGEIDRFHRYRYNN